MRKIAAIIFFLAVSLGVLAQSEAKADEYFQASDYAAAKDEYGRLLKRYPSSTLYLYRYARCAQELGDNATALQYFERAGNRYTLKHYYMGEACMQLCLPERAIAAYEQYLRHLEANSPKRTYIHSQIERAETMLRYLKRVEKIQVIDSAVVSMDAVLSFCQLSADCGTLSYGEANQLVYTNQRADRRLWAEESNGKQKIVSSIYLIDEWTAAEPMPEEINMSDRQGYPFLLSDGVTLYFASSDAQGMGGYDIYVTRFNTHTNTYTTPENIGFPYNSIANDYFLLIDEAQQVGYLATDRHSEAGKVTIYSFALSEERQYWRDMPADSLAAYALLERYERATGERRDSELIGMEAEDIEEEIFFALNDSVLYTSLSDFRSAQAKKTFQDWRQIDAQCHALEERLQELRQQYWEAEEADKKKLAPTILQMEEQQSQYSTQRARLIQSCREQENMVYQQ